MSSASRYANTCVVFHETKILLLPDHPVGFTVWKTSFLIDICLPLERSGMAPGTALGFFWALGGPFIFTYLHLRSCPDIVPFPAAAERRELYRFSTDLAKLALRIADAHGSSMEKWFVPCFRPLIAFSLRFSRAQLLYCSMVSGFDNVHLRSNLPRLEESLKYGYSAGDRYACSQSFLAFD